MSKWWAVHNNEDEVAHVGERPETQYEQPRAKLTLDDYNGARHSRDCEGDRGGEGIRQNLGSRGLQGYAKSTRTDKRILSKRISKRIVLRLLTVYREYAETRVRG